MILCGIIAIFGMSIGSAIFAVIQTEGHCVTGAGLCNPPACPIVINPCLAPQWPQHIAQNENEMIISLVAIAASLTIAMFAIRGHLKRKDFYVVRYRGG